MYACVCATWTCAFRFVWHTIVQYSSEVCDLDMLLKKLPDNAKSVLLHASLIVLVSCPLLSTVGKVGACPVPNPNIDKWHLATAIQHYLGQISSHVNNESSHICVMHMVWCTKYIHCAYTYISPLNILTAFWAITCLYPPVTMPVSSRLGIVLEAALAAFHRVVPNIPLSPSYKK